MVVTQPCPDGNTRTFHKSFLVADSRPNQSHWEYQLKDPFTGGLWQGGKWFLETNLRPA